MKHQENIFQLTKTTFFYATTPLRFSLDCFTLKYSQEIAEQAFEVLWKKMFPPTQGFGEFIAHALFVPVIFPGILLLTALQTMPYTISELAAGLLTLVPAVAIAITALPVMVVLVLGESICNCIANSNKDLEETHELALQCL